MCVQTPTYWMKYRIRVVCRYFNTMQSSRGMQIYYLIMTRKKVNVFYLRNAVAALIAQEKRKQQKNLCPIKKAIDFLLYNSCAFSKLLLLFVAGTVFVVCLWFCVFVFVFFFVMLTVRVSTPGHIPSQLLVHP